MFSILRLDLLSFGIAVAASVILGFVVYFNNRKSATHILFLLFTLVSSAWSIFNYMTYQVSDLSIALWVVRVVMFLAVYQAFIFFLLMFRFPQENFDLPKWIKYVAIPAVIVVSLLTLTPLVFSGVLITPGNPPQPVPAPGIVLFALVAVSSVIGGVAMMIKRIRGTEGKEKTQFKILALGVTTMFILIIFFNFVFVAVFGNSSFIPLSALFTLPFVVCAFYAIARHEFLNIKIIATEVITFILIITAFVEVILATTISEVIFRGGVFVVLLSFGILLIRSVMREVAQREKLQELTEKLKAVDKQKDEFVSMAAHELRSPMTAIKGYISMVMEGDAGDISEKARGFLADANTINERLIRLVNNMLNVSRIEEGRMVYQMEEENLSSVVKAAFVQFKPETERKGLKFELSIPAEIKDKVDVDADRIHEVVANLISNATKYTDKGSITVRLTQPNSSTVRFEVEDTGPGISPEEQGKLFQKFARAESTIGKTTGTGLGLYICKLLMAKFNGKIGLDSQEKKGSTFWFELPLSKSKNKESV